MLLDCCVKVRSNSNSQDPPLILVIDSSLDNLELTVQVLSLFGYTCVSLSNGQDSLTAIAQHQPDLVLMELMLPEFDAIEFVRTFRQQDNKLPIIALTSWVSDRYRLLALQAGFDEFIEKPYAIEVLVEQINRYLHLPPAANLL